MNPLIKPVYILMNYLSYRGKFLLIVSALAAPLIFLAVQQAKLLNSAVDEAERTREKLQDVKAASEIIQQLESVRDLSVLAFLSSDVRIEKQYEQSSRQLQATVDRMINANHRGRNDFFLHELLRDLKSFQISTGNEGAAITVLYDNAHSLVERANLWRIKLAQGKASASRFEVKLLLEVVDVSSHYLYVLGKARTFGSFYLNLGFIDSTGIEALDNTYLSLGRLIGSARIGKQQFASLGFREPIDAADNAIATMERVRKLLDEELIQPIDLSRAPESFFDELTREINRVYQQNESLLNQAERLLVAQENDTRTKLFQFFGYALLVFCVVLYLLLGFYSYISIAVRALVRSSKRVARGEYEEVIEFDAQDELREIAVAMDEMRVQLNQRERELREIGQTDGLTQLKNRHFFDAALPLALANCSRNRLSLSLILMDIDHFKRVNDEYGHLVGDDCIRQVTKLFREQFKRKTDIVARYGGEEFVAIIVGLEPEKVYTQLEDLRLRIEQNAVHSEGVMFNVTASFGHAFCLPDERIEPSELVACCDKLLYQAKNGGRNQVVSDVFRKT